MKKYHLLAPGPTPIPPEVLQAIAQPILHHRTPEFEALFGRVRAGLAELIGTRGEVIILAASGTGALEAAVVNLCSPGDEVLVVQCGKFGERWTGIARAFGLTVHTLDAPYGETVTPERVAAALRAHPRARALFVTQSETSTGVLEDVEAYAALTRRTDTLCVVDTVSSLGVGPCPMSAWGIDAVGAGSQTGPMCPPGLAFVAFNARAWRAAEQARCPRFYWDLPVERGWQAKNQGQFTPAVSLLAGLDVALRLLRAEGLEDVYRRPHRPARAARAAGRAARLAPVARAAA